RLRPAKNCAKGSPLICISPAAKRSGAVYTHVDSTDEVTATRGTDGFFAASYIACAWSTTTSAAVASVVPPSLDGCSCGGPEHAPPDAASAARPTAPVRPEKAKVRTNVVRRMCGYYAARLFGMKLENVSNESRARPGVAARAPRDHASTGPPGSARVSRAPG